MTLPSPPTLDDYDAIADAVMETERGRWFLKEYARRNRAADTAAVLDAVARLEERMARPAAPQLSGPAVHRLAAALPEISSAVGRAREAVARAHDAPEHWAERASSHLSALERLIDDIVAPEAVVLAPALLPPATQPPAAAAAPLTLVASETVPADLPQTEALDDLAFSENGVLHEFPDEDLTPDETSRTLLERLSPLERAMLFA